MTLDEEAQLEAAKRLLADETLATAFEAVRVNALVALAEVDATNTTEILRLQAIANCLNDVRDQLLAYLAPAKSGGFDPNARG